MISRWRGNISSPKVRSSASGILLEDLKAYLGETEVTEFGFHTDAVTKEEAEALKALAGTICTGRAQEYQ